ncbi:MAG: apolipoprotein N-acyltransferase Int [Idiomarinaceae bacterium HL-53]|nr:MAG: apolipoprotein N-acyltransferase Int [Idiomarinaceae bacterium HL-53]CUS48763.1 apolipoprotein N-acyltransferase [Idiomarinaceae bacterium HL-53]
MGRGLASLLLGVSLLFTYAPFSQSWLSSLAMAGFLLLLVRNVDAKQAAVMAWWFGFGWFGAGISWVYVSIDQFGGLPVFVSVFLMVLLCGYLALFPALAAWLWHKLRVQAGRYALWLFPLCWLIAEWLRGWLLTGFPWLSLGYSQTSSTLGNLAPHIGEIGITVAILTVAIAFAEIILRRKPEFLIIPVLIYALAWFSPYLNAPDLTGETKRISLVQGNIQQSLKWNEAQQWPNFLTYQDLSRPHYQESDLIIWPESAVTFIEPYAQQALADLDHRARTHGVEIITGIIDYDRAQRAYFNSIITLGNTNTPYQYAEANRYQKHHLLPIGEFVPFESILRKIGPLFNLPMSSFSRGAPQQTNLTSADMKIAANICYEVIFSDYIRTQVEEDTELLLTISNDSWFGRSHGPHQHFQIAQMRARELARPMLRATNNGVTGVIDEVGRVTARLPQFDAHVLTTDVMLVSGTTFYRQFGTIPAWLLAILMWLLPSTLRKVKNSS